MLVKNQPQTDHILQSAFEADFFPCFFCKAEPGFNYLISCSLVYIPPIIGSLGGGEAIKHRSVSLLWLIVMIPPPSQMNPCYGGNQMKS